MPVSSVQTLLQRLDLGAGGACVVGGHGSDIGTTSLLFDTSAGGRTSRVATGLRGYGGTSFGARKMKPGSFKSKCLLAFTSFVLLFQFFVYS